MAESTRWDPMDSHPFQNPFRTAEPTTTATTKRSVWDHPEMQPQHSTAAAPEPSVQERLSRTVAHLTGLVDTLTVMSGKQIDHIASDDDTHPLFTILEGCTELDQQTERLSAIVHYLTTTLGRV